MFDDFNTRHKKIERDIERSMLIGKIWFGFCALVGAGSIGFVVWVIVKVMAFYGIV